MLRKSYFMLAAAASAAWTGTAWAEVQSTLEQDAIVFGTREAVSNLDLSPDGSHAVFVGAGPGRTTIVYVADIPAGTSKPILYSKGDPETIQWCEFVSDARLVCRFTAVITSAAADGPIPASRTISLDTNGKDIKSLGQQSSDYDAGIRQFDGEIIDWLPNGGKNDVLMTRLFVPQGNRGVPSNVVRAKRGVGVVRLNVETLAATTVEEPRDNVSGWVSDGLGHIRLLGLWEVSGETYQTGRVQYHYRTVDSREWKPLTGYVDLRDFQPLAIDGTSNSLYAVRRYEGTFALTRMMLDDSKVETIVAHDPQFNVQSLALGQGHRMIGYTNKENPYQTVYVDPEYKRLFQTLTSTLPNKPTVEFVGESTGRNKVAVFAGRFDDPGRYYLFDREKKSIGELVPGRPGLADRIFGSTQAISYPASDGTMIAAELTLPPNVTGKNLPGVVFTGDLNPRDSRGFDWLAQFLVARGYAVIEPRFRGFGGGDPWFYSKGFGGWHTSVSDVSAATRYLAAKGIADPNRIAIIGWTHGGCAALLAAATEPNLYKAVVAVAPITDLAAYKADWSSFTSGKRIANLIGNAELTGSPIHYVSGISAPVLLIQGTADVGVQPTQGRRMQNALRQGGKQSEILEFDGLDRNLEDSNARAAMLLKIGQLLDRTIGH